MTVMLYNHNCYKSAQFPADLVTFAEEAFKETFIFYAKIDQNLLFIVPYYF